jgi:putative iron-regulated protein
MKKISLLVTILILSVSACKKDKKKEAIVDVPVINAATEAQKQQTKQTYANIAFAVYDDAYLGAQTLKTAINIFVSTPTASSFETCKQKWLAVREVYGLTETFRFAEGPIDNQADGPEGFINAWPMDEAYVDYVIGNDSTGIINNLAQYPTINVTTLLNANENGGEENISLGFHAVEFLLWGQDVSATSAGTRPYTDFLISGGTASNQARRGQYLNTTIDILIAGLKQVRDAWEPTGTNNYYKEFLALDNTLALRKMMNSLKVLSGFELSGERMFVAYTNMDQEDEHSCFSDNTHRDIYLNAKGMQNLYNGTYTRTNQTVIAGYALKDLIAIYDGAKNTDVVNTLNSVITKINLMYIPFDQAIVLNGERPKVLSAVNELQTLETKIKDAAKLLGITF